ncbi:hypothetical protein A2467_01255 [Candidatus Nomurabacteria bacterium RIFOXYC2_FULL_36_8]|nr:MAG: hypothetical protein UR97_C0002G0043 [Candidatus Nomurabacteria bacterium GW2011_GWE2_36_115]KKP94448.1 MAG: hypothetical protein US00_C0001G0042 [Candidatus Nomurabacteria bacterium GW2011_GWF2_36_126]KKP96910.1 MAG: hypothetical protein US04_C0001G0413 [Candidatus Nomurabacteria bacterium GW2011_GWD2_36_14]KKP99486.1 MAG: hypothetical protein US08_C0001G0168 [Candidatus Nomurabacteria bacterium GW2011_GWF2_36_19]KKQ05658.1 MAG: hypothetical protein US17_C0002G0042 [Candidatus Nomuraba
MENRNISQIAIERIKDEGIKPISRNIFSIKRVLFWVLVASSFIIGAITFSLVLSALFNNDWDLYNKIGFSFIFRTLPYFWLISLAVFTVLGEYYYRKTYLGHRRGFILIMGVYLVSTTVFGSLFYLIGTGRLIEQSLENEAPIYRHVMLNRYEVWSHPEAGFLSGRIIRVMDNEVEVIDSDGFIWIINMQDVYLRGRVEIEIGERIKIIGKCMETICIADEIRPWIGMRRGMMR